MEESLRTVLGKVESTIVYKLSANSVQLCPRSSAAAPAANRPLWSKSIQIRFQICQHEACIRWCKVTLVTFIWLFSIRWCIVTVWLFFTVCFQRCKPATGKQSTEDRLIANQYQSPAASIVTFCLPWKYFHYLCIFICTSICIPICIFFIFVFVFRFVFVFVLITNQYHSPAASIVSFCLHLHWNNNTPRLCFTDSWLQNRFCCCLEKLQIFNPWLAFEYRSFVSWLKPFSSILDWVPINSICVYLVLWDVPLA